MRNESKGTKADDPLAANGITSWIFGQSQADRRQARMIPKHHEDRWTKTCLQLEHSVINQAKRGEGRLKGVELPIQSRSR